jgi:hypothetical protein
MAALRCRYQLLITTRGHMGTPAYDVFIVRKFIWADCEFGFNYCYSARSMGRQFSRSK